MHNEIAYEPTPDDIARATAEIRRRWTDKETRYRVTGTRLTPRWTPPVIRVGWLDMDAGSGIDPTATEGIL